MEKNVLARRALKERLEQQTIRTNWLFLTAAGLIFLSVISLTIAGTIWLTGPSATLPVVYSELENVNSTNLITEFYRFSRGPGGLVAALFLLFAGPGLAALVDSQTVKVLLFWSAMIIGFTPPLISEFFSESQIVSALSSKVIFAPPLLSANHIVFKGLPGDEKLTTAQKIIFDKDMSWLKSHPLKDWSTQPVTSISNKSRYLLKLYDSACIKNKRVVDYIGKQKLVIQKSEKDLKDSLLMALFLFSVGGSLGLIALRKAKIIGKIEQAISNDLIPERSKVF